MNNSNLNTAEQIKEAQLRQILKQNKEEMTLAPSLVEVADSEVTEEDLDFNF